MTRPIREKHLLQVKQRRYNTIPTVHNVRGHMAGSCVDPAEILRGGGGQKSYAANLVALGSS